MILLFPLAAAAAAGGAIAAAVERRQKARDAMLSVQQLRHIIPGLSVEQAQAFQPWLVRAMREFGITERNDQAAFLAQLAFESDGLKAFEEYASGSAYEGRADLGNTQPGDGVRYKGRGPIQLTGRANYRAAGLALDLPLENNPTRAADVDVGFRIAGWYWRSRNLSALGVLGTEDSFKRITVKVNGSDKTVPQRTPYWQRARAALLGVVS